MTVFFSIYYHLTLLTHFLMLYANWLSFDLDEVDNILIDVLGP